MKKTVTIVLAILIILAACSPAPSPSPSPLQTQTPELTKEIKSVDVNIGMPRGPGGMGAAFIAQNKYAGTNNYITSLAAAPTELVAMLSSGELDIAILPTNTASALYNKLSGGISMLALSSRGVLYILENGGTVQSVSDLRGRTIYAFGQGANPEYSLNYLLRENGLEPGTDVTIEFRENDELAALAASGEIDLCMLPVPSATSVLMKNPEFRPALDLTAEWDNLGIGGMHMTCAVVRTEFAEENPAAVAEFMADYDDSLNRVTDHEAGVNDLIVELTIAGSAQIAERAIDDAYFCFITGENMQPSVEGYFEVLYSADPISIGGAVPDEAFYYKPTNTQ